jgi:hypothetical protein
MNAIHGLDKLMSNRYMFDSDYFKTYLVTVLDNSTIMIRLTKGKDQTDYFQIRRSSLPDFESQRNKIEEIESYLRVFSNTSYQSKVSMNLRNMSEERINGLANLATLFDKEISKSPAKASDPTEEVPFFKAIKTFIEAQLNNKKSKVNFEPSCFLENEKDVHKITTFLKLVMERINDGDLKGVSVLLKNLDFEPNSRINRNYEKNFNSEAQKLNLNKLLREKLQEPMTTDELESIIDKFPDNNAHSGANSENKIKCWQIKSLYRYLFPPKTLNENLDQSISDSLDSILKILGFYLNLRYERIGDDNWVALKQLKPKLVSIYKFVFSFFGLAFSDDNIDDPDNASVIRFYILLMRDTEMTNDINRSNDLNGSKIEEKFFSIRRILKSFKSISISTLLSKYPQKLVNVYIYIRFYLRSRVMTGQLVSISRISELNQLPEDALKTFILPKKQDSICLTVKKPHLLNLYKKKETRARFFISPLSQVDISENNFNKIIIISKNNKLPYDIEESLCESNVQTQTIVKIVLGGAPKADRVLI